MATYRLLKFADYKRMPWKNGGGSTLEIASDTDETLSGFGWRLSIADVATSGAFSAFIDYQRVITVLEGEGMNLEVDGRRSRDLTRLDAFAFSGGSTTYCELLNGPIRDFNLIYAPAKYAARLQWLEGPDEVTLFSSADIVLLFSAAGVTTLSSSQESGSALDRYDCGYLETGGALTTLRLKSEGGQCCLIELVKIA
ncbi:HutD/Ves family protein [Ectopseudomonas oleovorans]|uniref:HutD family protein n=1 Tax=Ectopseudomonas oleovorans TaxID=301 RepID=A0AA42Q880_ECTOL|nr:HutD family protein [Pseudomonas oleovorans]MDH1339020.1 HutD family protein [Pseudomonas oleovorans]MDH1492006.1 HutD family protein [Pseudomonas oleovorans]WGG20921.1 HutD family protein [Pseudomonas oleovorans]